MRMAK